MGSVRLNLHPWVPPNIGVLSAVVILIEREALDKKLEGIRSCRNKSGNRHPVSMRADPPALKLPTEIPDSERSARAGTDGGSLSEKFLSLQCFHKLGST